ncbi:MAG TPA: DUF2809 domain-containing protein [Candidatus Krumholzibacteria bacterium]|nr:DUF2809 domain-containing protein [Candidatus Krumholzibacteria bacterium]HPD72095.1 DUF2809 domain-containing protein [Candidatus Krumholzibacteria bacterium]HRY40973.1 DUF2809 domain-containing protein [Candidatus Krumholzibacteria bacterium]
MTRIRALTALSLAVLVPAGFAAKHYAGWGHVWLNDSFAGALYVVFWILVGLALAPRARPGLIAGIVLAATCALEVLQLVDLAPLVALRRNYLGRVLVGSTFVISDFLYYAIGAVAGWAWAAWLRRKAAPPA